jgi:crotonobetainyl-CoA:carnitine CoA-transferase CaiB-like acyl-CoA transferase
VDLVTDARFADRETRKRNRVALKSEIEAALAARSAAEWSALLNGHGVPAGEVLDVPDVLNHPQVTSRRLTRTFAEVPGVDRPVTVVRSGYRMASGDPGAETPPPRLGVDTEAVLQSLGYDARRIEALRAAGAI